MVKIVIAKQIADSPKQFANKTRESNANHLLYMNLRLDLLIRLWVIAQIYLLTTRDLDCFGDKSPRNDGKRRESAIRITMTNKPHPLAPSAREGELAELPPAMNVESQINPKDSK